MTSSQKYKLYYLVDPSSKEIRYVGVTKLRLQDRLKGHLYKVNRKDRKGQSHKSAWIQSLINQDLKPEIHLLQSFTKESDVFDAEKYWISYFKEVGCDLTNSCEGGRGCLNPSPETRRKISESSKGNIPHQKAIIDQYGTIYSSLTEASRKTGVDTRSIPAICKGKIRQSKGYVFAYYEGPQTPLPVMRSIKKTSNRPVIDQNGVIYESIRHATRELGFKTHKSISNVLTGRAQTAGGMKFYYYNEAA